jgi:hypothetical protein
MKHQFTWRKRIAIRYFMRQAADNHQITEEIQRNFMLCGQDWADTIRGQYLLRKYRWLKLKTEMIMLLCGLTREELEKAIGYDREE